MQSQYRALHYSASRGKNLQSAVYTSICRRAFSYAAPQIWSGRLEVGTPYLYIPQLDQYDDHHWSVSSFRRNLIALHYYYSARPILFKSAMCHGDCPRLRFCQVTDRPIVRIRNFCIVLYIVLKVWRACHQPESKSIAHDASIHGVKFITADCSPRSIVLDFQSTFSVWETSHQPDLWTSSSSSSSSVICPKYNNNESRRYISRTF